jgi:hypothetical protein
MNFDNIIGKIIGKNSKIKKDKSPNYTVYNRPSQQFQGPTQNRNRQIYRIYDNVKRPSTQYNQSMVQRTPVRNNLFYRVLDKVNFRR